MPPPAAAPTHLNRADRIRLALAFIVPIAWFFAYNQSRPDYLVDESGHLGNIYHFLEHKAGWPEQMTMLPGYHFIVAALWQLHPPVNLLTLARGVSLVCALLATAAFYFTWRRVHAADHENASAADATRATLLFALLPIAQPFSGLAYTDTPALAFVLGAFLTHLAGHRALAALLFAGAACVRQTNLLWAAFVVAWEFLRTDVPRRSFLPRAGWLALLLAGAAIVVVWAGRFTVGTQTGTETKPNIATLHFAALLTLGLLLPAFVAGLPTVLARGREFARRHLALTIVAIVAAFAATALAAATFANPHGWNRDLFWDGCTFTLLRNWPLVWIDTHPWLRVASGANLVLMALACALSFSVQPRRKELWLALAFGALLPLANNLVEPRYFIAGAVFMLIYLRLAPRTSQWLMIWWAVLNAAHAPFIARGLSLW